MHRITKKVKINLGQKKNFKEIRHEIKDKELFKKKLKDAWKTRRESPDYLEGIRKMVEGKKGHKHSEESKKKISEKLKGKKKPEGFSEKLRNIRGMPYLKYIC